ncbi:MAG: PDZ domain-containing protein [Demequina sp.]
MSAAPPPPPVAFEAIDGDVAVEDTRDPGDRRSFVLAVTGLGASVLIALLSVLPAPYAIGGPGPTFDTLSEVEGVPLVEINGTRTFAASGELRLTTVSVARGSSSAFTLGRVLRGWADEATYVVPEAEVFGTPGEEEVFEQQSAQAWISSQESATVAALEALGRPVTADLEVAEIDPSSLATGLLQRGDVILEANGVDVPTFSALSEVLAQVTAGDDVTVSYERGGEPGEATFATLDDGDGGAMMGLWINPDFDIPIDVTVQIDSVGGPSAGLMFSLAIMDMLTEADELAGARVAGTGTISASGDVGAIGGIVMKMHGAVQAGAEYFLAPSDNCADVVGNVPAGLDVYSVETLDDAYEAIIGIGNGDTDGLQACRSP